MRQNSIFSTCKCNRTKRSAKCRILSHFSFPKTLFPFFLHHLCLQFLYLANFLVRECFSFPFFLHFRGYSICEYWQVLTSCIYDIASLIEERALTCMQSPPLPPPLPTSVTVMHEQTPAFVNDQHCTKAEGLKLVDRPDFGGIPLC